MKADEIKQYMEKLAQKLPEDQRKSFLQAASDDELSKELAANMKRHDEYSRDADKLRADREEFAKTQKEINDWYARALPEYEQTKKEAVGAKSAAEQAQRMVQQYQSLYGPLEGYTTVPANNPGNGSPSAGPTTGDYVSKADLAKEVQRLQQIAADQAAGIVSVALPLGIKHFEKFHEVLDFNSLIKAATESGAKPLSPIEVAYERMTSDKSKALEAEAQKKHDDQIRADAIKDFQSKNNIPVDTRPRESSVFFDRPKDVQAPTTDYEKTQAFAKIWSEVSEADKART